MTAFIGLTKGAIDRANGLLRTLEGMGITTYAEAEVVCTPQEIRLIQIYQRVKENPDINLWNQHPKAL